MEDELDWEHHIPANEWDQQSSGIKNTWDETTPTKADDSWGAQASTRVNVTEWYPPKANVSS